VSKRRGGERSILFAGMEKGKRKREKKESVFGLTPPRVQEDKGPASEKKKTKTSNEKEKENRFNHLVYMVCPPSRKRENSDKTPRKGGRK